MALMRPARLSLRESAPPEGKSFSELQTNLPTAPTRRQEHGPKLKGEYEYGGIVRGATQRGVL